VKKIIDENQEVLINKGNESCANMKKRGGGVK
jgi:hypothetical protein